MRIEEDVWRKQRVTRDLETTKYKKQKNKKKQGLNKK